MNKSMLFIAILIFTSIAQAQTIRVASDEKHESQQASMGQPVSPLVASNPGNAKAENCGCELKASSNVLAIVNGVKIIDKDIDAQTKERVSSLQRQVIEARKRELELQVNTKLLDMEAKKRSMSPTKVVEAEAFAKVKEPTEAEALAFYEKNKGRIQGDFKEVKSGIIGYLRNQYQREETKKFADRLRAAALVKIYTDNVTPPVSDAERARVLATVNGAPITSGDIENSLRPLIFNVQQQVYELQKMELDSKINNLLLEQEAQKRKITTKALLDAELAPKVKKVTETDARKFYDDNKEKIGGDFTQLKDQIMQYLQGREVSVGEGQLAEQLRRTASIQMSLPIPAPPVYNIAIDDQPLKGNAAAPVTIVEFTDYQCSSCAKAQPIIEKLLKEYGDKVRLVVRDFPLPQHADAFKAAEAAEAAREQGKYWEYVAILMQNQSALGAAKLKEYASQLSLNRQNFDAALDSHKFSSKVERDLQDGMRFGINSTPTVFVNGQQVLEKTYESLKAAIDAALNDAAKSG